MKKLTTWALIVSIYLSLVAPAATTGAQVLGQTIETRLRDVPPGLQFRLSEGVEGAETREKPPLASTDPLSQSETSGLLKRIPAAKGDPADQSGFAKRVGTMPAPKTGSRIPVKFPSDDQRGTPKVDVSGRTLQVVRFSPEGEIELAPDLSVTFSQPMVAVTSQQQAASYAPVELSPQVEGRWRWLGTKTLMFDTDKRFPMATKFTARVPAGTKSATGQTLAKDAVWTFTTPPPKVEQMTPNGQIVRRDALIFVSFDQEINPEAVLRTIGVTSGGRRLSTRLATEEEIARDPLSYFKGQTQPRRWLAFRVVNADGSTENALPAASNITVTIEKGTPSAEGPLITTKPQAFSFKTFGPLKLNRGMCGWQQNNQNCSPFDQWMLEFTNGIDVSKFSKEMVLVEPAVEGLKIYPSGNHIYIDGYKKGKTTYKVTVDGSISDIFGQTLGTAGTASIRVGTAPSNLYSQGGFMSVLDPGARTAFSIYSTNHQNARVRIYAVQPEDWAAYGQYVRRINYDDATKRPTIPGRLVSDQTVAIASKQDEMVETSIDLSKALTGGLGNLILEVEPTIRRDQYDRTRVLTWLQATNIGLDAFVDNSELVGFATDLRTGKPLSGVDLLIYPNGSSAAFETAPAEPGMLDRAWGWLMSWRGGPSAETQAFGADGGELQTETVEPSQSNRTGENGILRLSLPTSSSPNTPNLLIARRGGDTAFLPENSDYYWQQNGNWFKKPDPDQLRWFVFDDRRMYKPKEEVAVKGYIRKITGGKFGDVEGLGGEPRSYEWSARDPRGNEFAKGSIATNPFGAFDLKFSIPDNTNLGSGQILFHDVGRPDIQAFSHQFQIQEFRRPEFEVSAKVETEAPHFVGGQAMVSVEAKYYAGGGLASADTNWTVTANATTYTPPNRDDFTFGTWVPWWNFRGGDFVSGERAYYGGSSQSFKGITDASGKHVLKIHFQSVKPPRPYAINASAAVQDVNRQTWAGNTSLLVHPASVYIGIKTPRTFVQKGEKIEIESIVTDLDGNLVAGRDAEIKAVLNDWRFDKGSWKEETIDEQTCSFKSSGKVDQCAFVAKAGGRYTVTATVVDERERFNESEFTIWVPGGKTPPKRNIEQEEVQIIPSKKDYAPGDVAELLVISPFTPAEGVLTLRRDGLVKTERFSMKDSSITLKIPLEEKYLPNITAQVDLVGAAERNADTLVRSEHESVQAPPTQAPPTQAPVADKSVRVPMRPAFASGNINLAISTASRKLTVVADPIDKTLMPGGETKVNVEVKDHHGEPVSDSEVAIVVVDESVLALSAYRIADPMSIFYTARGTGVTDYHMREHVILDDPDFVGEGSGSGSGSGAGDGTSDNQKSLAYSAPMARSSLQLTSEAEVAVSADETQPINLRQNFDALAVFSPSVKTDSSGRAIVDIKLPDNLTRYRITAVAVDSGRRFGKTESNITAKQPLMVRPSAPRFMNFGDRVDLPVVVQNQTDKDMTVDVAIRATNAGFGVPTSVGPGAGQNPAEAGTQSAGKRVVVKANDRAEVRFPVSTIKAGTARFQIAVTSGSYSDAAEISLPVWTPATTEAFATYGTTEQNGAIIQPIETPADVYPQFGGLEVTTSSTQLQELTDAFIYLANYPYGCSEQIASRMISTAALRDVLSAFKAKDTPTAAELEAQFARDIEVLNSRQRDDGSFGLWKKEKERYEYPFLTIHVAHALALAKSKGYKVPDEMLNKTKPYLKNIEKHFDEWYKNAPQVRWTVQAYALYIRDMMGDKDAARAKRILADATVEKLNFEAMGWILSVLAGDAGSMTEVAAILAFINNRVTETASTANFVTKYDDGGWLIMHSNRRADGILLEAMIKAGTRTLLSASSAQDADRGVRVPNDLIPKLVRGLLAHRTRGHWGSTQENVFILLALDRYFAAYEKVTPDFVARVWLGNTDAGEQAFRGRTVDSNQLDIPMSYLLGNADTPVRGATEEADKSVRVPLIIDKQGPGRLYYRIGMKNAPRNLKLEPADYGFTVLRKYEAIDDKDDVKQNADGSWIIKSGSRVRVRLTMVAQARRYHVALVDNLPAGLEILNPELAATEAIPADQSGNTSVVENFSRSYGRGWWWSRHWFEHQNFRDERAEAFSSLLWEGVYNYSYVARATTPGQFIVPPAKAEEMYSPETFGRTGTDFVRVE